MKQRQSKVTGYHALMAAVIDRAILDLKGIGPRCGRIDTDRAMAFILGEDCETFCFELGMNYEVIKREAATLYQQYSGTRIVVGTAMSVKVEGALDARNISIHEIKIGGLI